MTFLCTHLHPRTHLINSAGIGLCQLMLHTAYKSQKEDLALEISRLPSSLPCLTASEELHLEQGLCYHLFCLPGLGA